MHRAVAKKKILAQEMVPQKNSGRLKIPHPPHHFSNGPSLMSSGSLMIDYEQSLSFHSGIVEGNEQASGRENLLTG